MASMCSDDGDEEQQPSEPAARGAAASEQARLGIEPSRWSSSLLAGGSDDTASSAASGGNDGDDDSGGGSSGGGGGGGGGGDNNDERAPSARVRVCCAWGRERVSARIKDNGSERRADKSDGNVEDRRHTPHPTPPGGRPRTP